jgi:hypothetical protein
MGTATVNVCYGSRTVDRPTVDEHDVPLLDALLPQDGGKGLDLIEQLPVRDALLGVGDGAVVEDGGGVAVAGEHVAVNTVVAG